MRLQAIPYHSLSFLSPMLLLLVSYVNFRNSSPFGSGLAKVLGCVNLVWLKIQLVIPLLLALSIPEGMINSLALRWIVLPESAFHLRGCPFTNFAIRKWWVAHVGNESMGKYNLIHQNVLGFFAWCRIEENHLESYFPSLFYR